ncbi:glycosyl hydrolase family 18 protein [Flavobacterium sp. P21]|uniref:glycosyl hydrolase family 18 protein n=1 Tax=Flavobacterium sp. P21 TaxID=3423948 RepID=UPI003D67341E
MRAHAQNIKVFVSLGGGSVSEGGAIRDNYFNLITPANRTAFIQKLYDYVVAHNFDGIDVDLEGPAINGDYGGFVIALANKLHANGKLISASTFRRIWWCKCTFIYFCGLRLDQYHGL